MIVLQDVTKTYELGGERIHAADHVSLSIEQGEFVAVIGPSGSGKTTLMNLIGGLDRPESGTISVSEQVLSTLSDRALAHYRNKTVGYVFQDFHLQARLSALENVEFPLIFSKMRPKERRARARTALRRVGLGNRTQHRPSELSGGQRQRVAIARALVTNPLILLADEPTGNLDSHTGAEIAQLLRSLHQEEGLTVILVTHDPELAKLADRTIRIRDGKAEG